MGIIQKDQMKRPRDCRLEGVLGNKETFSIQIARKRAGLPYAEVLRYGECGSLNKCGAKVKYQGSNYCTSAKRIREYQLTNLKL